MFKRLLFLSLLCFLFTSFCDNDSKRKFYIYNIKYYKYLIQDATNLYNLGNFYFKLKDYPNALMFWRRAQKKNNHFVIRYNIKYLKDICHKKQDSLLYKYLISFPILLF